MAVVSLDKSITLALSVSDRRASAKWYEDMLGFELLYHADEAGWSEMKTFVDGVTLGLGEQVGVSPGNTLPVFGVGNVAEAREALEKEGVKFDGPTQRIEGMVSLATFYDPDNNALMLAEDLSGQRAD
ncbi:VOC family protein [Rhodovibrionaceae bacterium A322]